MIIIWRFGLRLFDANNYIGHRIKLDNMKKKENNNIFVKMIEDNHSIIRSIREGVPSKTIEQERGVEFVTPV